MEEQEFIESREEMEKLLREEDTGYLGLSLDGQPYVVRSTITTTTGESFSIAG